MAKSKKVGGKREEIIALATALVKTDFGGSWPAAFAAYAGTGGKLGWDGVSKFLSDAGVSPKWTLRLAVAGVFRELDANGDGFISESEFFAFKGDGK